MDVERMVEAGARGMLEAERSWPWDAEPEFFRNVWRAKARAALTAALADAEAQGAVLVRWPPTGDDVNACADEVHPYEATHAEYSKCVETVMDVLDAYKARAKVVL